MKRLISWVEIPVLDMERAITFYNAVFDLNLELCDYRVEKMACFPNGEGALFQAAGYEPSQQGTIVSLTVEDMGKALEETSRLGGRVLITKTKIHAEGRGYFGMLIDPEGNKIGLYSER